VDLYWATLCEFLFSFELKISKQPACLFLFLFSYLSRLSFRIDNGYTRSRYCYSLQTSLDVNTKNSLQFVACISLGKSRAES
jgi:hypothetical protein